METYRFIEWKPYYSVGNKVLDEQHRRIFELCRDAIESLLDESAQSKSRCYGCLSELASNVVEHYRCEEDLLNRSGYVLAEHHRGEHELNKHLFHQMLMSAYKGNINKPLLTAFLSEWAADHIIGSDKQFAKFVSQWSDSEPNAFGMRWVGAVFEC